MQVPITRPWFDESDFEIVRKPLETGWVAQGPYVAEFERLMAAFTGTRYAVACTSATTGLHLALAALGIGPGDEVLVPAFTWLATANAVLYQGATPVLCDIELSTFNVDFADLEAKRTARTKAVMPVHLFGLPVDMAPLRAWAATHELHVVEDAACGLGSRIDGVHVGGLGACGVFSFHPRKAVTTGEGGMVVTNDETLATTLRSLRNHGGRMGAPKPGSSTPPFSMAEYAELGFNYRMTDLQGALGVTQMAKAARIRTLRDARAQRYHQALAGLAALRLPQVPAGVEHGWQSYVVLYQGADGLDVQDQAAVAQRCSERDALMLQLAERGVQTRPGTHAVHALALYRERFALTAASCPNAWLAERLSIALPLFPTMTDAEQDYVVAALESALQG